MTIVKLLLIIFMSIVLAWGKTCPKTQSCSLSKSFDVRFPFRLIKHDVNEDFDSLRCGYPGFDLSCNDTISETIISLPSGDFIVENIDYKAQNLTIKDSKLCLPKHFIEKKFSLAGTPFRIGTQTVLNSFTFINCSFPWVTYQGQRLESLPCLSKGSYTVHAIPKNLFESLPPYCEVLATVLAPQTSGYKWWSWYSSSDIYVGSEVQLQWDEPNCQCGDTCGYLGETGLDVGCSNHKHDFSNPAKITFIVLVTPTAIIIFLLIKFGSQSSPTRLSNAGNDHHGTSESNQVHQTHNNNTNNNVVTSKSGLAKAVIEAYPKSLVGESPKLLSTNYKSCPICLLEYRTNDTLRTLPDCFHYFHADCVDEWLKLNATCPLCRNSPLMTSSVAR